MFMDVADANRAISAFDILLSGSYILDVSARCRDRIS